jgi:hypothetical protein
MLSLYVNTFESDLCADSQEEVVAQAIEGDPDGNTKPGESGQPPRRSRTSNGWQQQRLAQLGVEVGAWIESIHAFQARVPAGAVEELRRPRLRAVPRPSTSRRPDDHDEGMPMSNADLVRAVYDGSYSGQLPSRIHRHRTVRPARGARSVVRRLGLHRRGQSVRRHQRTRHARRRHDSSATTTSTTATRRSAPELGATTARRFLRSCGAAAEHRSRPGCR